MEAPIAFEPIIKTENPTDIGSKRPNAKVTVGFWPVEHVGQRRLRGDAKREQL